MQWPDHSRDRHRGEHALFSPSQGSWRNDETVTDVTDRYFSLLSREIGTIVHAEAHDCILTNTKFTKNEARKQLTKRLVMNHIPRSAINAPALSENFVNYVNDAIGFGMIPEKELYYSEWVYGTTDAIIFDETKHILRIHDLKTGSTPAKFRQLELYAALFFLDVGPRIGVKPGDCRVELRIYQGGEVLEEYPTADIIVPHMDSCVWHSRVMDELRED